MTPYYQENRVPHLQLAELVNLLQLLQLALLQLEGLAIISQLLAELAIHLHHHQ